MRESAINVVSMALLHTSRVFGIHQEKTYEADLLQGAAFTLVHTNAYFWGTVFWVVMIGCFLRGLPYYITRVVGRKKNTIPSF